MFVHLLFEALEWKPWYILPYKVNLTLKPTCHQTATEETGNDRWSPRRQESDVMEKNL